MITKARLALGLFILLLIIGGCSYLMYAPLPVYEVENPSVSFVATKERIAEGKRIALTICIRCHYNYETGTLAGRQHGNPKRVGNFYSGNITNDSATGIGGWSVSELYYFLKTGIKRNGEYVFDMPKYSTMHDEDLYSIIAFLKSNDTLVSKTNYLNPRPQLSFIIKLLLHTIVRPPDYCAIRMLPPDTNDNLAFGKYLATSKFSCYECHSYNRILLNYNEPEKSIGYFKGGNPQVNEQREKIITPNITGDSINGIGMWSDKEFIRTVKNGIKPDGTVVRDPMFPFHLLTDKEAKAIYIYLQSL